MPTGFRRARRHLAAQQLDAEKPAAVAGFHRVVARQGRQGGVERAAHFLSALGASAANAEFA